MRLDNPRPLTAMVQLVSSLVPGVLVATKVPDKMPDPFIRVERLGGRNANRVTGAPRMAVQVWSPSGVDAALIAEDLELALIEGAWSGTRTDRGHRLRRWEPESVMRLPDPDREHLERYQVLGKLHISLLRPDS